MAVDGRQSGANGPAWPIWPSEGGFHASLWMWLARFDGLLVVASAAPRATWDQMHSQASG